MEYSDEEITIFRTRLRRKVLYHLGSFCPDVDDVVQESLMRFVKAAMNDRIQKPESAAAFLSSVCNHVISEYRRRIWREPPAEPKVLESIAVTPANEFEITEAVEAALHEMSGRDREVLCGLYLEGKTREEICQAIGITDSNLRLVLFRARTRFRKIYSASVKQSAAGSH